MSYKSEEYVLDEAKHYHPESLTIITQTKQVSVTFL